MNKIICTFVLLLSLGCSPVTPNSAPRTDELPQRFTAGTYPSDLGVTASESPLPIGADQGSVIRGALSKEDIKRVIRTQMAAMNFCYEKLLTTGSAHARGRIVTRFTIQPDGRVGDASVDKSKSTLEDPALQACILDVVRKMTFPEPTGGGSVTVFYPFFFSEGP